MAIELGDGVVSIKGDTTNFNKALNNLRQVAGKALVGFGALVTGALAKSVKAAADFEQAITNAASVTGATGDELVKLTGHLEDVAQELGSTTVFSASEAANALTDLARKGFDVASISAQDMKGILDLAAATQTDLSSTTQLVTSTLNTFGLTMSDSSRVADIFAFAAGNSALSMDTLAVAMQNAGPTANALGISLEETVALIGKLLDVGLDASTAGTGLRNIAIELANPTNKLSGILKELGINAEDLSLKNDGLAGTFGKLVDAGITTEGVLEAFGKRGGPVALALFKIGEGSDDAAKSIQDFIGGLTEAKEVARIMAEVQLATLNGQIKLMQSALEAVMIPLGKALIPALTETATKVATVFQSIARWAEENRELFNRLVKIASIVGIVSTALGVFLLVLPTLIAAFAALGTVLAAAGAFILGLAPVWGVVAAAAVGAAILIVKNWDSVKDSFSKIIEFFKPSFTKIKNLFIKFTAGVRSIWGRITEWFQSKSDMWNSMLESLKNIFSNVFRSIGSIINLSVTFMTTILEALGLVFKDNFDSISESTETGTDSVLKFIESFLKNLETFTEFMAELLVGASEFWSEHSDIIVQVIRTFVNFAIKPLIKFVSLLAKVFARIVNMLTNFTNTTRNIFNGIVDFVSNTVQTVLGWIDRLLNALSLIPGSGSFGFPGFAAGGITTSPLFIAGEGGRRELVASPVGSRVFNANDTESILAGAGNGGGEQINNNFSGPLVNAVITKEADVDIVLAKLERRIVESRIIMGSQRRVVGVQR